MDTNTLVETILRSLIFVAMLYVGWAVIRIIRWMFRSAKNIPHKAGEVTATTVNAVQSVKDSFVDGYKNKR